MSGQAQKQKATKHIENALQQQDCCCCSLQTGLSVLFTFLIIVSIIDIINIVLHNKQYEFIPFISIHPTTERIGYIMYCIVEIIVAICGYIEINTIYKRKRKYLYAMRKWYIIMFIFVLILDIICIINGGYGAVIHSSFVLALTLCIILSINRALETNDYASDTSDIHP